MGLINQFDAFATELAEYSKPIRELLCKKSEFIWNDIRQVAFKKIISTLISPRVLAQYNPNAMLRLETDAAQSKGLGFALWQKYSGEESWRLLQCGSRSTTPAESRYSATEIELQAVVWAMRKCHLFLMGKPFKLIVDHKPLQEILNYKTLNEIDSPRQQRLTEKTRPYEFTTIWRPGKDHVVVDCFSRFPADKPDAEDLQEYQECSDHLNYLRSWSLTEEIIPDLATELVVKLAKSCGLYTKLKYLVRKGFPEHKAQNRKSSGSGPLEIICLNDLLLVGSRILVPKEYRKEMLKVLHTAHQGQERTFKRARQAVYWPGLY